MRPLRVSLFLSLASAVGLAITPITPKVVVVDKPSVGTEVEVDVGESLVARSEAIQYDALRLLAPVHCSGNLEKFTLEPGVFVASAEDKDEIFYFSTQSHSAMGVRADCGLSTSKENPQTIRPFCRYPAATYHYKFKVPPDVRPTVSVDEQAPGFWQELIYNGKSGDTLRFLYREFRQGLARPAFNQELEFNLSEGRVVGVKGARIEILEATNVSVRYRVISHFAKAE